MNMLKVSPALQVLIGWGCFKFLPKMTKDTWKYQNQNQRASLSSLPPSPGSGEAFFTKCN